ncbi:MAG: hypothetical protein ABSG27_06305 [Candidatus Acidiferrales bacterium]|jgi:hypothetical protein
MFETPDTEKKSSGMGMWIGVALVVIIIAVGAYFYTKSQPAAKTATPAAAPAATAQSNADAVHDLRVVSAKMDKDPTGNVAIWSVDIKNQSSTFTYSAIAYQTTYIGADNSVLLQNAGKVNLSLDPGDEQTTQFRDALYPSGTAVFRFAVTGASATK